MAYKLLVINPGSTSTKFGVFEDEKEIFEVTLRHTSEEIEKYNTIFDIKNFGDFRMFASSKWKGKALNKIKLGSKFISTETYCKFMAWWLSDGSISIKKTGYRQRQTRRDKFSQSV